MLRFLGKSSSSMVRSVGSSPSEEELSNWELVNASQSDNEDLYSYDSSDDVVSDIDGVIGDEAEPNPVEEDDDDDDGDDVASGDVIGDTDIDDELEPSSVEEVDDDDGDADEDGDGVALGDVIAIQTLSVSPPMSFPVEMAFNYAHHDYDYEYDDDGVHDMVDDDDMDDGDYDVDDELVPWKLKDRFGKQRIKKMGKRGGPKFGKSKRVPYYDNRPGFVYGKFRG